MSTLSDYANLAALVPIEWVNDHLEDPQVRLLEVDADTSAYERGHVRCAVGLNWTTQLGDPIRRDIPTRAAFEHLMRQCGVSNATRIISTATTTTGSPPSPTGSAGSMATSTPR